MSNNKTTENHNDQESAANLVRQKISQIYKKEPDAKEELKDSKNSVKPSKHQEYMNKLSTSGMSLAEIQTAWHNYYVGLPDNEKREVWNEFYSQHDKDQKQVKDEKGTKETTAQPSEDRSVAKAKRKIQQRVITGNRKLSKKDHLKSIFFGLGFGALVALVLLFGFFNERFIAPLITPSRAVSNTPIIIDPSSSGAGPDSKVIIPKINVEVPVVYDEPSVEEKSIQNALERGVVHYATTSRPGEKGNTVIFGHSSNNILNKGQYKFAFVLLNRLDKEDTFILQKDGKRYVYKVVDKKIVTPKDVSVLTTKTDDSIATLITCDPPGTSINRLLVTGKQVSPDPTTNVASTAQPSQGTPEIIPSNAPSLWERITSIFSTSN